MNEEKYEVSLEINTKNFDRQCKQIEKRAEASAEKVTKALFSFGIGEDIMPEYLTKIPSGTKEELQKMQDLYLDQIGKLEDWYEMTHKSSGTPMTHKIYKQYSDVFNKNLDLIEKGLAKFGDDAEETSEKTEDIGENTDKSSNKFALFFKTMDKGFDKGFKKVKRFTLGLLGVRSAYFAMNKAMSNYLQNDQELSDKLQSIWTGLGVIIAPIVEMIADTTLRITKYILYIANAITGMDLLQKAMDKTSKKMDKSLSSLDEVTNVAEQSNLATLADMLDKVEIDTEWADKLTRAIKPIYDFVAGIVDFSIKHPEVLAVILGGLATVDLIGKIIGIYTVGKAVGLAGIAGLLVAIAGIGLTIGVAGAIDAVNKVGDALQANLDQLDEWNKKWGEFEKKANEDEEFKDKLVRTEENSIKRMLQQLEIADRNNYFGGQNENIKELIEKIDEAKTHIEKLTGKPYEVEVNVKSGGFLKTLDNLDKSFMSGLSRILLGKDIYSYDVGTNYVPNDQLAMVHEGEAIVPKKFNNQEFFGNSDGETKDMLFEIIDLLRENGNKVPVFNMDSREFARATYQAYQNEGKRLGVNTSIERS